VPVSSILLVDDDESTFHFTQALVRDFSGGHTTLDWEPSYDGGLATLLENRHDVALIDFRLGTDDGVQLLRDARKGGCATPLIMLTGRAVRGTDAEALSAGADDYLVKGEVTATQLERSLRYAAERRHVRDLLKKREADYRATFENAPIGMAHTGLDGRWLRVNERLKSLLGYSEDQLLSTDAQSLTHPDDIEASATGRAQLLDGTLSLFATEKRYRRADGDYLWVHLTVSVRRSAGGQPRHFIATMEDISARKLGRFIPDHISRSQLPLADLVYYADKQVAYLACAASGQTSKAQRIGMDVAKAKEVGFILAPELLDCRPRSDTSGLFREEWAWRALRAPYLKRIVKTTTPFRISSRVTHWR